MTEGANAIRVLVEPIEDYCEAGSLLRGASGRAERQYLSVRAPR